ncbi:MAG TPA: dihydrofolate reductase, partial [Pyrinomonadaceae bacterium]|nr:dihydrofolate reductase [Pyrinomonadaceae bacterium]
MIIGIVAIAKNLAIGRDGKLPWHYSADLKFFKETTTGHAILMGSNTWRSIGRPLPNRTNIVISRRHDLDLPEGVELVHTKDEALAFASGLDADLYVIGGAEVFRAFADDIDNWIVTEVPANVEDADTFMPSDFLDGFNVDTTRDLGEGL